MSDLLADLALRCETDTQTQKSVLWFLAYRQNPKTGQNNWSVPNMAKQLSMSDRSVQKSIRYLCASVEEGGIAVVRRTPRPNNSCNYFVIEAALRARANIEAVPEAPPHPEGEPETLEGGEPNSPLAVDGGESDSPLQEENEPHSPAGEHGSPLGVNEVRPKESKEIEKEDTHTHQEGDDKFEIIKMLHVNGFDVSVKDSKLLDLVGRGADLQLFKKAVDSSLRKNNPRIGYLLATAENMLSDSLRVKPFLTLVKNGPSTSNAIDDQASLQLEKKKALFSKFQTFTLACAVLDRVDCTSLINDACARYAGLNNVKTDKFKNPETHWIWLNFKTWAEANRPEVINSAFVEPHHLDFEAWLDWDSGQQNIKACG